MPLSQYFGNNNYAKQVGHVLERSHPLAQGLLCAYIFPPNGQGTKIFDLVDPNNTKKALTLAGASTPRWYGQGLYYPRSVSNQAVASTTGIQLPSGPVSVFCHYYLDISTFGGGTGAPVGFGTVNSTNTLLDMWHTNLSQVQWIQGSDDHTFNLPAGQSVGLTNCKTIFSLDGNKNGIVWFNGSRIGTCTKTGFPSVNANLAVGNSSLATGDAISGFMFACYVWTRAINEAEVRILTANPYDLLKTPTPRRYFGVFLTAINVSVSDTLTFSDSQIIQFIIPLFVNINDSISLTDTLGSMGANIGQGVLDIISFSDLVRIASQLQVKLNDTLTISDAVQLLLQQAGISLSDTITLSDSIITRLAAILNIQVSDNLVFSDNVNILLNTAFTSYIRRYLNDVI